MPFRLGRVRAQDLQVSVREAGVVDPATKVDVKAAVSGRVRFVAPAAEVVEKVRVFKVEVALDHLEDSLRTGMSANVEILGDRREDAVSVPLEALHRRDGQAVAPASVALAWLAALGMAVAFGLYPALRAMGQSPATARR
jgi:multidrug efflux pump subunit AcrA (membrane-fusion protein)